MSYPFTRSVLTFTLKQESPEGFAAIQKWCADQGIKSMSLGDHYEQTTNELGQPALVLVPGYQLIVTCKTEQEAIAFQARNEAGFDPVVPATPDAS